MHLDFLFHMILLHFKKVYFFKLKKKGKCTFHYFRAPFDVSMTVLGVMVVVIIMTWTENFGDKTSDFRKSFTVALNAIRTGRTWWEKRSICD